MSDKLRPFGIAIFTDHDLIEPWAGFGPVVMAQKESMAVACCGDWIQPGEDIRDDGYGNWIHADTGCEALARGPAS